MTKEQSDKFMDFFKEKNVSLFDRLSGIVVFTNLKKDEDKVSLLFWPALNKPYITKEEEKEFGLIMAEFKKVNKIYPEVPTIVDDFANFLARQNERLYLQLNGGFDVIFEDGKHFAKIDEERTNLSKSEEMNFFNLWDEFYSNLKMV